MAIAAATTETLIKRLNIAYNRQRQAAITELVEIISGAEAL